MASRQLFDAAGQPFRLGPKIGAGGEGAVFEVDGRPKYVAKIYHRAVPPERAAKLKCMLSVGGDGLRSFAAWPTTTVHEAAGGPITGLVLPRIENSVPIHELYSPASRRLRFPNADWQFLVRVARNCAAAMATVHEAGIVIGDVNQGNLFVSAEALVRLIDCDSFQVRTDSAIYRCEVGVPHFTPPELHGANFRDIDRSPNHDTFGLAVVLFHLLYVGRHPFAGRCRRTEEMPIERAIREHRFAFSHRDESEMLPPPFSLSLDHLPPEIAQAFEQAFSPKGAACRPSAKQWGEQLTQLERQLTACPQDPGHKYWGHLKSCPWCDIMDAGGPNFFETVAVGSLGAQLLEWKQVWKQVHAVPPPPDHWKTEAPPELRLAPAPAPQTSAERLFMMRLTFGVGLAAAALSLFTPLHPLFLVAVPLALIFGVWWILLDALSELTAATRERRAIVKQRQRELDQTTRAWGEQSAQHQKLYQTTLADLSRSLQEYRSFDQRLKSEIRELEFNRESAQRRVFLQQFLIRKVMAQIACLNSAQLAQLESYGVETAWDVNVDELLKIPGIDESTAVGLWAWREALESQFNFDPTQGIPPSELRAVKLKLQRARLQTEQRLTRGPSDLWQITRAAREQLAKLDYEIAQRIMDLAKAKSDLRVCEMKDGKSRWPLVLVSSACVGLPLIMGIVGIAMLL